MNDFDDHTAQSLARKKFLGLSLESTRKSYYPQLQKQLEIARENERRLRLLIDNLPAYISYINAQERYVFVNREYEKGFGLKPDQIIGKPMELIYGPDNYSKIKPHIQSALRGKEAHFEHSFINQEGESRWFEVAYCPDVHPQGGVAGFYVLSLDVTEKKRAEQEREKLTAQLIQAQKMESVGRLAGGLAHDFNNMLGIIFGYVELAMAGMTPDHALLGHLEQIMQAAERSADLIRQLLAFARKQTAAPKVLDLNEILANMLNMLGRLIGEDIELTWLPTTDLWPVNIDPSQIDQIVVNLCVNARDAIAGTGKITIETRNMTFDEAYCAIHSETIPGDYVRLVVSDNGCGMDKEILSKLFEPFFTTKERGKGTGLGLATVYGIVKQNRGFINIYSEPGVGSSFKLYFPRHVGSAAPQAQPKVAAPIIKGYETILLVEDELVLLTMAKIMLEQFGYQVLDAATPTQALQTARDYADQIHLLITDVVMPEMSGLDLAEKLVLLYPEIKHLFMSGYTNNVIAHHGLLDKGIHFIQKPFSMQSLAAKVREALSPD